MRLKLRLAMIILLAVPTLAPAQSAITLTPAPTTGTGPAPPAINTSEIEKNLVIIGRRMDCLHGTLDASLDIALADQAVIQDLLAKADDATVDADLAVRHKAVIHMKEVKECLKEDQQ